MSKKGKGESKEAVPSLPSSSGASSSGVGSSYDDEDKPVVTPGTGPIKTKKEILAEKMGTSIPFSDDSADKAALARLQSRGTSSVVRKKKLLQAVGDPTAVLMKRIELEEDGLQAGANAAAMLYKEARQQGYSHAQSEEIAERARLSTVAINNLKAELEVPTEESDLAYESLTEFHTQRNPLSRQSASAPAPRRRKAKSEGKGEGKGKGKK